MTCHRSDRDLLIFKAICGLSECADACHDAPIEPTLAIRFAVAFLYAHSNGERCPFDGYLEAISRQWVPGQTQQEYLRATNAQTEVKGMMHRLIHWKSPGVTHELVGAVKSGKSANEVWRTALAEQARLEAGWVEKAD